MEAKGYEEKDAPQSDSPMMLGESIKMFFSVAANEDSLLIEFYILSIYYKGSPSNSGYSEFHHSLCYHV